MEKSVPKIVKMWYTIIRTKVRQKIVFEQIVKPIDFFNRFAIICSPERRLPKLAIIKLMKDELISFVLSLTEEEAKNIIEAVSQEESLLALIERLSPLLKPLPESHRPSA